MYIGQFFYHDKNCSDGSSQLFYWNRVVSESNSSIYVMVEPDELTFGMTSSSIESNQDIPHQEKSELLRIPLKRTQESELKVKLQLEKLITEPLEVSIKEVGGRFTLNNIATKEINDNSSDDEPDSDEEIDSDERTDSEVTFADLFKDFLWDLKYNEYFNIGGKRADLLALYESYHIIYGIGCKLIFDELFKISDTNAPIQTLIQKRTEAIQDWLYFLTNDSNEVYFTDKKYYPDNTHWFETVEKELESPLDKLKSNKELLDEPEILSDRISKYLFKRYSIQKALKYFLPNGGIWSGIVIGLILLSLGLVVLNYVLFYSSSDSSLPHYNIAMYGVLLFSTIIILGAVPVIFSLLGGSKLKKRKSKKHSAWYTKASFNLFLPRMSIAIMSGWLIFLTTEELFKVDIEFSGFKVLFFTIVISLASFIFLYNEITGISASLPKTKARLRVLLIFCYAFMISFSFGFISSIIFTNDMLENQGALAGFYLVDERKNLKNELNDLEILEEKYSNIQNIINQLSNADIGISRIQQFWDGRLVSGIPERYRYSNNQTIISSINRDIDYHKELISQLKMLVEEETEKKGVYATTLNLEQLLQHKEDAILIEGSEYVNINEFVNFITHSMPLKDSLILMSNANLSQLHEKILKLENEIQKKDSYPFLVNQFKQDPKYIARVNHIFDAYIIPNSLIFRTLLAIFIGIFLQLIVQERAVTEPI